MKTVNAHIYAGNYCIACGCPVWSLVQRRHSDAGLAVPQVDTRTCIDRPDYTGKLAPEPKRRVLACEDAETISKRLAEIRAEAVKTEPEPDFALYLKNVIGEWTFTTMVASFDARAWRTSQDRLLALSEKSFD